MHIFVSGVSELQVPFFLDLKINFAIMETNILVLIQITSIQALIQSEKNSRGACPGEFFCSSKCRKNSTKLKRDRRKVRWSEFFHVVREKARKKHAEREAQIKEKEHKVSEKKAEKPAKKKAKKSTIPNQPDLESFFNGLEKKLKKESYLVKKDSMSILKDFEGIDYAD